METKRHQRPQGYEASARHIERALERVRAALGDTDTTWKGLAAEAAVGVRETEAFARKLAEMELDELHDPIFNLFLVRQLEVAMALISRLSHEMSHLEERLDRLESRANPA